MALVAGRDGLQRLSGDDAIHPFFRSDTTKALNAPSLSLLPLPASRSQPSHEFSASSYPASSQEMTCTSGNDLNDSDIKSTTARDQGVVVTRDNAADSMDRLNAQDNSSGSKLATKPNALTTTHGKPVRKRRKLGSKSELPGNGKQGTLPWYQPADLSAEGDQSIGSTLAPDNPTVLAGERDSDALIHHETKALPDQNAHQPVGKSKNDNLPNHHVSPPKKVMKLRADGKLFSPPKKDVVIRPIKGDKKTSNGPNRRLATLKYGDTPQSRRKIGETIERILNGTLRIKPLKEHATPKQEATVKIVPPPKVEPHPFFLGQRKVEGQKDHPPVLPKPKNTSRASSPHRLSERGTEKPAAALLFGSATSKIVFPNESQEPIWPPHDMLHVRDDVVTKKTATTIDKTWMTHTARKAKEPAVCLEEIEEIWHPLKNLVNDTELGRQVQWESDMVPAPARQIMIRSELQTTVSDLLNAGLDHEIQPVDAEPEISFKTYTCKSMAAQRLFDTLPSSSSAFDNFRCENQGLAAKYAPKSSTEVFQSQKSMQLLKSWLSGSSVHSTTISTVRLKQKRKSTKKRRQVSEFDDFIATSEDDDPLEEPDGLGLQVPDMTGFRFEKHVPRHYPSVAAKLTTNTLASTKTVVLSGPHGCGKTAAVYALAHEMGFEVFEINPGSRRSGRDILERVGDMMKNHLVSRLSLHSDEQTETVDEPPAETEDTRQEIASGKQSTMQLFFKKQPVSKTVSKPIKTKSANPVLPTESKSKPATEANKTNKNQKQSLILLEEVDVLFEEDKQFWTTVISLITTSKRPIIMTCNDESALPTEVAAQCSLVRFSCPPMAIVTEYLLLIAAHEGHLLSREAVSSLYSRTGQDLRASIMQLSFWCQMAVKDPMNGLNWILFPQDYPDDRLAVAKRRVMSQRTFLPHMGILGNNQAWPLSSKANAVEWLHDAALEWNVQAEDFMNQDTNLSTYPHVEPAAVDLSTFSLACDVLSASEILQSMALLDEIKVDKHMSEFQQSNNFMINPPVVQSTPESDIVSVDSGLIATLSCYAQSAVGDAQHRSSSIFDYYRACNSIVHLKKPLWEHQAYVRTTSLEALDLLIGCDLERLKNMATDLAPYMRSIVSYDSRLEQERDKLDRLLSDGTRSGKRQRTTRASRAALEGGHKASTRRERWFECELDFPLILETGGKDWQEIAWSDYQRAIRKWKWTQQAENPSSEDELCS